ncbi:MAG: hypothetical protein WAV54_09785 [Acidimicrobiales bacterium]
MNSYRTRIERGLARGLSVSQARGHPSRGTPRISDLPSEANRLLRRTKGSDLSNPAVRDRMLAAEALGSVRSGDYPRIRDAERAYGLPAGTVARQLPGAVERRHGRLVPTATDREAVAVVVIAEGVGNRVVVTRGSRVRSMNSAHRRAVQLFLRTGDEGELHRFAGKKVGGVPLEVRPAVLETLFSLGSIEGGPYPELPPVAGQAA